MGKASISPDYNQDKYFNLIMNNLEKTTQDSNGLVQLPLTTSRGNLRACQHTLTTRMTEMLAHI